MNLILKGWGKFGRKKFSIPELLFLYLILYKIIALWDLKSSKFIDCDLFSQKNWKITKNDKQIFFKHLIFQTDSSTL